MKLKLNKLFLFVFPLSTAAITCLAVTSCSTPNNPYASYSFNTPIILASHKQANQLYDIAKTKVLPQTFNSGFDFDDETSYIDYMEALLHGPNSDIGKSNLYWEMALNIAEHGKENSYKFDSKNPDGTNLVLTVSSSDWFDCTYTTPTPSLPIKIKHIAFNYFDNTGAKQTFSVGDNDQEVHLKYDLSHPVSFSIDNDFKFSSWMFLHFPKIIFQI